MHEEEITKRIVTCAIEVHRTLGGPGLLESVYEEALVWELQRSGLIVARQVLVPIDYKGVRLASPLRLDLLVNDRVIIEVKATTLSYVNAEKALVQAQQAGATAERAAQDAKWAARIADFDAIITELG